jgi:hypothetical protein
MLGERDALGAMLGPGGWGRCSARDRVPQRT